MITSYNQSTEGCFESIALKALKPVFETNLSKARELSKDIAAKIISGEHAFVSVLNDDEMFEKVRLKADQIRQKFSRLLVFGTGGSGLGGQALVDMKRDGLGYLSQKTQVSFCDNIDPATLHSIFEAINPKETCFMFVSKSGGTLETISQFLVLIQFLKSKNLGHLISENFLILTEPKNSQFRELASKMNIELMDHHTGIGGRFSVLSNVGLLPAAVAGVDISEVRNGAREVVNNFIAGGITVAESAAVAKTMADSGRNIFILMPYLDRFRKFNRWYIQLWSESVGKNGSGTTPVDAIGTVDQHSQLQLYLDGPDDKYYTIMYSDSQPVDLTISSESANILGDTGYLANKKLGEILLIEAKATAEALIKRNRPCRILTIPGPAEKSAGALFAHYMLGTVLFASLLGVNPFDQPAVEEGKIIARRLLGGK